jgi:hypothetical protein
MGCPRPGLAQAAPAASHAPVAGVAPVVAGILGYTRWPAETATLRLCTVGRSPGVDELRGPVELGTPQRRVLVQAVASAGQARAGCEAVYVAGGDPGLVRETLRQLAGQPVLLLGEGADFCSDGGMFCLEPGAGAARFGANLDAIARSGLRVNPMVLRIARGTKP